MRKIQWWFRRGWQLYVVWLQKRKVERDLARVLKSTDGLLEARRLLKKRSEFQAQYLAASARGDLHQARIAQGALNAIEELIDGKK